MTIETFTRHLIDPVLPETIPWEHVKHPAAEGEYQSPPMEYAFCVHGVIDRDFDGQFMFIQVCKRNLPVTTPFGEWHYGFYYRGGDSSWDVWTLDINHGTNHPTYAAFGAYVDQHC